MLFPTFTFAVFFAIVLVVGWLLHQRPIAWKFFMLGASYVFYGYWDWRFLGLIAASSLGNQILAVTIHRARSIEVKQVAIWLAVGLNLGVLVLFKYAKWFGSNLEKFGLDVNSSNWNIILPVGISFFTFQALSYVLDVYRGKIEPGSMLDFFVYLAFFPQLVAGPIVRASEFMPQLAKRLDPRNIDMTRAFVLIGSGLFKKVVISSYVERQIVDPVFSAPSRASGGETLLGIYGYAVQIYADFSGYSDIAIGVALLLGFTFPQNFDRPYYAETIQEFWHRWHMTLSRWLRDYLYISLGGNRKGERRRDINMFLTMFLGGLWHGAAWNFVVWGVLHGAGLGLERRFYEHRGRAGPRSLWLGRLVTFHFVCLGWVFFRATDPGTNQANLGNAFDVLARLLTGWDQPSERITTLLVVTIAASLAAQFVPKRGLANIQADGSGLPAWTQAVAFGAWLLVLVELGDISTFIYFQF